MIVLAIATVFVIERRAAGAVPRIDLADIGHVALLRVVPINATERRNILDRHVGGGAAALRRRPAGRREGMRLFERNGLADAPRRYIYRSIWKPF
jgi:hypothetical protein